MPFWSLVLDSSALHLTKLGHCQILAFRNRKRPQLLDVEDQHLRKSWLWWLNHNQLRLWHLTECIINSYRHPCTSFCPKNDWTSRCLPTHRCSLVMWCLFYLHYRHGDTLLSPCPWSTWSPLFAFITAQSSHPNPGRHGCVYPFDVKIWTILALSLLVLRVKLLLSFLFPVLGTLAGRYQCCLFCVICRCWLAPFAGTLWSTCCCSL